MERLLADANKINAQQGIMTNYSIDNLADVYEAIHVVQRELGITGATADEAATTLTGSFNSMKAAFSDVLGNLALGNDIQPSLNALAESTKTFLVDNLVPAVGNIFRAMPGAAVTFIKAMIPGSAEEVVNSISSSFVTFMQTKAPDMLASGGEMLRNWAQGIKEFLPELGSAAGDMIVAMGEFLTTPENLAEIGSTVWAVGEAIVNGVWNGIVGCIGKIYEKWPQLFEGLAYNPDIPSFGGVTPGTVPGFATGLNYVPYDDFVARLHEGEMVLTRAQANAYRNGQTGGGITVVQHIYSEAKTAADLMQAARYQQEVAVLENV